MRRHLSKKAVSPVIGYILLITFVIIISVIVYQWVKTYIPREALECPDGVSIFVKEKETDCSANPKYLNLTLKNNGLFNISGYFIRASYDPNILATNSLWNYIEDITAVEGRVTFASDPSSQTNELGPGMEQEENFTFGSGGLNSQISFVEIIPVRYEDIDNRHRLSSCSDAKITEIICEDVTCVPQCDALDSCGLGDSCGGACSDAAGNCLGGQICSGTSCVDSVCGNGAVEGTEQCDTNGGTFCESDCSCTLGYRPEGDPSISCIAAPDLTISTTIGLSISRPDEGQFANKIQVSFRIENTGTADATNDFEWSIASIPVPSINPLTGIIFGGLTQLPNFAIGGGVLDYGSSIDTSTITLNVDSLNPPNGNIIESNEVNNQIVISVDCTGIGRNDPCPPPTII